MVLLAIALAMDASAVSLGVGTSGHASTARPIFRLSFHFGLFQSLMTLLGWLAGAKVAGAIAGMDHWIAVGLLAFVGVRMIRSGLDPRLSVHKMDPSRGASLVLLCVATSIDALAAGLSLAMLRIDIVLPAVVIGLITSGLSLGALLVGHRLGNAFGKRMEIVGGVILNAIGLRVLLGHLI